MLDGHSHVALAAADVVLVASGTATLETLLHQEADGRGLSSRRSDGLVAANLQPDEGTVFSQPNLLAGERIVPELFQEQVSAEALGAELLRELDDTALRERQERVFSDIHRQLERNASDRAAEAILGMLAAKAVTAS